jgi:hypothetical protein
VLVLVAGSLLARTPLRTPLRRRAKESTLSDELINRSPCDDPKLLLRKTYGIGYFETSKILKVYSAIYQDRRLLLQERVRSVRADEPKEHYKTRTLPTS